MHRKLAKAHEQLEFEEGVRAVHLVVQRLPPLHYHTRHAPIELRLVLRQKREHETMHLGRGRGDNTRRPAHVRH